MKTKKLLSLLILSLLTSCGDVKPFSLDEKYYNNQDIIIKDDKCVLFNEALSNKESFVAVIYSDLTCINNFKEDIAYNYFSSIHLSYYQLEYAYSIQFTDVIEKYIKYTPSVMLFKKGKCIKYLQADKDEDIEAYNSLEGFSKWFNKYIYVS